MCKMDNGRICISLSCYLFLGDVDDLVGYE